MSELSTRVERLEREVRTWRRVAIGSVLVGATLFATGWGKPVRDLVMAKRIELVDEVGRTRIVLSADYTQPTVALLDETGEQRLKLTLDDAQDPHVQLIDQYARTRVDVRQSEELGPAMIMKDATGTKRSTLATHPRGTGFVFFDRAGEMRLGAVVDDNIGPSLHMFDDAGKLLMREPSGKKK